MWTPKIIQFLQLCECMERPFKQLIELKGHNYMNLFDLQLEDNEFFLGSKACDDIFKHYNTNIPQFGYIDCFIDEDSLNKGCTFQNRTVTLYGSDDFCLFDDPLYFTMGKARLILDKDGFTKTCKYNHISPQKSSDTYNEIEVLLNKYLENEIVKKRNLAKEHLNNYTKLENNGIEGFFQFILENSFYTFDWDCSPIVEYNRTNRSIIVDYYLPLIEDIPNLNTPKSKGCSFGFTIRKDGNKLEYESEYYGYEKHIKYLSETALKNLYDEIIYKIILRSVGEIFHFDSLGVIDTIFFNGRIKTKNKATGKDIDYCILSVQINREQFENIDMNFVDAKACFKHLKGVSAAKLHDITPITPILTLNKEDKRFVESHNVKVNEGTNLAAIDWEEFEHLVREIFDLEFNVNGGEVKVTQSSRDGGVDAIAFDPDPIRGGKIVIQAKRYTNTVGVSAVRDLYGTIINEGANKGILITTSDYGSDSYKFAIGKPITLLNGGHLLYLLQKHGRKARIDIEEAKRMNQK